jgi:hypothetical protein
MRKLNNAVLVITSVACSGIIGLAYYERYAAPAKLPAVIFYLLAAAICLLPVVHALYRHALTPADRRACSR